ncbi:Serpentine type 7TM GPCR chemoreceptor Srx family protein [Acanthocheilonema viteae]
MIKSVGTMIWDANTISLENFCSILSPITNSIVYAAVWMQFVLAINRFWAISYPLTYHRIFNSRNVRVTAVSLWSFSMLITVLYYNVECREYFEADIYSWSVCMDHAITLLLLILL